MLYDKHSILYTLYAMSGFEGIKLKMEISTFGEDILLEGELFLRSRNDFLHTEPGTVRFVLGEDYIRITITVYNIIQSEDDLKKKDKELLKVKNDGKTLERIIPLSILRNSDPMEVWDVFSYLKYTFCRKM